MGAFRGLAIDYLWIKAAGLREEGKHFQSLQLARWICDLQPRFPSVWAFQAWEMAYNISVTTHTPEERWTWVYGGVKLLRDKGIPYNPACLPLYKELAWIYFHKMGDILDDMHWAYKAEWAVLMQRVLGAPNPNATAEEAIDAIRVVGAAPQTLEELIQTEPRVATYVGMLEQAGIELGYPLLAATVEAPIDTGPRLATLARHSADDTNRAAAVPALPGDESWTDVRNQLVAWVRADILRQEFKLDPSWMVGLMEKFGPLDWRATYSHALYWSTYGDFRARKVALLDDIDALNNDRLVHFSLSKLIRMGKIILDANEKQPNRSYLNFASDLRFIEPCHQTYIELGERATGGEGLDPDKQKQAEYFRTGHANFLTDSIRLLYLYGADAQRAQARKYYRYLRENFKGSDGKTKPQYQIPLEEYAQGDLKERVDRFQIASSEINVYLGSALQALADDDVKLYHGSMGNAKTIHDYYMRDKRDDPNERRKMKKFRDLVRDAIVGVLQLPAEALVNERPPRGVPEASPVYQAFLTRRTQNALLMKARIWSRLSVDENGVDYQRWAYDPILATLEAECEEADFDPAKAFPEPPGMKEFREKNPVQREGQQTQDTLSETKQL